MQLHPYTTILKPFLIIILLAGVFSGCENHSPLEVENFDAKTWQSDRNGCEEKREAFIPTLMKQTDVFIGVKQKRVMATLGRPDRVELDPRMKRTHYYYVEPGNACEVKENEKRFKSFAVEYEPIHRKVKSISISRLK